MDLPIEGKTIFEPGAGIGDQTEWLLEQGAKHVWVQDGREDNVAAIRERFGFGEDERVTVLPAGDLEKCLPDIDIPFVDLVFCYGVYYHIRDPIPEFPILRQLARF